MPTGDYPPPGDSPWKDQPSYLDVGYSGGGGFGSFGTGGDDGDHTGGGNNMDMDTDEAMGGLGRPALLALIGIFGVAAAFWYAREPSPVVEQPAAVVAPVVAVPAPNPVVQPAPPDPRAQPPGAGHWVWIPEQPAPGTAMQSYSIPGGTHHP